MVYLCVLPPDFIIVGKVPASTSHELYKKYGRRCENVILKEKADIVDLQQKVQKTSHGYFACIKGGKPALKKRKLTEKAERKGTLRAWKNLFRYYLPSVQANLMYNYVFSYTCTKSERIWRPGPHQLRYAVISSDGEYIAFVPIGITSFRTQVVVWNIGLAEVHQINYSQLKEISCIAFSPSNNALVSGGYYATSLQNTSKGWETFNFDSSSSRTIRDSQSHDDAKIHSVAFSNDGSRFVSGGSKAIHNWSYAVKNNLYYKNGVASSSVFFSPDSSRIVSNNLLNNDIIIYDAKKFDVLKILRGHTATVCDVLFSPDGSRVASGSNDTTVKIWDANSGKLIRTLTGHSEPVNCVLFSPDGSCVVSGSKDNTLKIWDPKSGELQQTLHGHNEEILSIWLSTDNRKLISTSSDYILKTWEI